MSFQRLFDFLNEDVDLTSPSYGYTIVDSESDVPFLFVPLYQIFRNTFPNAKIYVRSIPFRQGKLDGQGVLDFFVGAGFQGTGEGVAVIQNIIKDLPLDFQKTGAVVVGDIIGARGFRFSVDLGKVGRNPFDIVCPDYTKGAGVEEE